MPTGSVTANDGKKLEYDLHGSAGPWVVLLHGGAGGGAPASGAARAATAGAQRFAASPFAAPSAVNTLQPPQAGPAPAATLT